MDPALVFCDSKLLPLLGFAAFPSSQDAKLVGACLLRPESSKTPFRNVQYQVESSRPTAVISVLTFLFLLNWLTSSACQKLTHVGIMFI